LSVVIEGGNDGSKQIQGFYEFILFNVWLIVLNSTATCDNKI
jgi:hypothetical protein